MKSFFKKLWDAIPCIGDHEIRLGFTPLEGAKSGYYDCKAIAADGAQWESSGGIWKKLKAAA